MILKFNFTSLYINSEQALQRTSFERYTIKKQTSSSSNGILYCCSYITLNSSSVPSPPFCSIKCKNRFLPYNAFGYQNA